MNKIRVELDTQHFDKRNTSFLFLFCFWHSSCLFMSVWAKDLVAEMLKMAKNVLFFNFTFW